MLANGVDRVPVHDGPFALQENETPHTREEFEVGNLPSESFRFEMTV